jgi:predicted adenine nucleotide alpha hydrolase (AANH) superfamily ATPase
MKILMHLCCANCALYPVKTLRARGHELTGYWFNPNIEPEEEYGRRLAAVHDLGRLWALEVRYHEAYDNELYKDAIDLHSGERCEACYRLRLDRTARVAREEGVDAFSTSLLVSPYQRHELVREAGLAASEAHGVEFVYEDFRPGWPEGTAISREMGLYRQNYCGCLASKREREEERARKRSAGVAGSAG